jgi:U3 small nucleolar RNA-associated protein 12
VQLVSIQGRTFLGVLSTSKRLTLYTYRSAEEAERKRKKRVKKAIQRQALLESEAKKASKFMRLSSTSKKQMEEEGDGDDEEEKEQASSLEGIDERLLPTDQLKVFALVELNDKAGWFVLDSSFKTSGKQQDASSSSSSSKALHVIVSLASNKVDSYLLPLQHPQDITIHASLEQQGHRGVVRAVALAKSSYSSQHTPDLLASVGEGEVKIWQFEKGMCVNTIPLPASCSQGLCLAFLPGNTQVVVGTKDGSLVIVDLTTSSVASVQRGAHQGAVWTLQVDPMDQGIATGGADKVVNFWSLKREDSLPLEEEKEEGGKKKKKKKKKRKKRREEEEEENEDNEEEEEEEERVFIFNGWALEKERVLRMGEEVLCLRFSNSRVEEKQLIAVPPSTATSRSSTWTR